MDTDAPRPSQPPREPIFKAPAVVLLLAASIPAFYLVQTTLPDQGLAYAFRPASLVQGVWWPGVMTSMVLHGSWPHALINAAFALAFAPPVARLFPGARGAAVFFAYYIVCGLIGTLGYGLVHLDSHAPMVGASGAVTGLLGGAVRLIGARNGPTPLTDRRVIGATVMILALNAATGVIGLSPGMGTANIAWEAHVFGYLAGLLLIGPLFRMFGRRREPEPETQSFRGPWVE